MPRVCLLAALLLAGCPPEIRPDTKCKMTYDKEIQYGASVAGQLQTGPMQSMQGGAGYQQLLSVKTRFDTLQRDYAQMASQLCEDWEQKRISQPHYEQRRTCLDQAHRAMRALAMSVDGARQDPNGLAFSLGGGVSWLEKSLRCEGDVAGAASPPAGAPLKLTAYLVCQRRQGGDYADVPACDGAALTAGDRIKIGFSVDRAARIYVLGYNSTGQFQTLFPAPNIDNEVSAGAEQYLPPGERWLELDEVGGVTEILQIVAAEAKVPELEALRGRDDKPAGEAARVAVEPFITRGFKQDGPPITLQGGAAAPAGKTVPMIASRPGVVAVELQVVHR